MEKICSKSGKKSGKEERKKKRAITDGQSSKC